MQGRDKVHVEQKCNKHTYSVVECAVVCSGVVWSDMMLASDDLLFMCSETKQKY